MIGIPIANDGQLQLIQQSASTSGVQSFGAATNPPNFGDSRFKQSATSGTNVQKTAAFDQMVQDAQPPQQPAQAASAGTITSDKVPAAVDLSVGYDTVANCPPPQVCLGTYSTNLFTPSLSGVDRNFVSWELGHSHIAHRQKSLDRSCSVESVYPDYNWGWRGCFEGRSSATPSCCNSTSSGRHECEHDAWYHGSSFAPRSECNLPGPVVRPRRRSPTKTIQRIKYAPMASLMLLHLAWNP